MAKFKNPIKSVLSEVAFKTVYSFLGEFTRFWGIQTVFGKVFGNSHFTKSGVVEVKMKKKNFKGRCKDYQRNRRPLLGGGGYVLRVFANTGCAVILPNCP